MYSHIQSWVFCIDKECLYFLIKCEIFSLNLIDSYQDTIMKKEIEMSRLVLQHGWNIVCLYKNYKNIDFRLKKLRDIYSDVEFLSNMESLNFNDYFIMNDNVVSMKNNYSINNLVNKFNKYELIFMKNNRMKRFK